MAVTSENQVQMPLYPLKMPVTSDKAGTEHAKV
jgi:hypothetical protein